MNHKKKKEDAVLKVARELFNRPIRTVGFFLRYQSEPLLSQDIYRKKASTVSSTSQLYHTQPVILLPLVDAISPHLSR